MGKIGYIFVISIILISSNTVYAQFTSESSVRSYGMGGLAESLGDDPLTLVDNISAMGRNAKQRSHLLFSFSSVQFWDHVSEDWSSELTKEDNQFKAIRLAYIPEFNENSAKWMLWVDSIIPSVAWEGRIEGFAQPEVRVIAKILEIGFGTGFALSDSIHMGLGIGMTFAFAKFFNFGGLPPINPQYKNTSNLSTKPVCHLSFEVFISPQFVVSLNSVIFISYFSAYENEASNWEDIDATYIAGNGFLEINLSMAYEFSPFFHLTGGYQMISYKAPDYAEDDVEDWKFSGALGFEYIIKLGGTFSQFALRAGVFMENISGENKEVELLSFWDYKKMGLRTGFSFKLGILIFDAALSIPFNSKFENDVEILKLSAGFRFK
ncbi:MAG: hypothetical protein K8S87_06810 [Planctomycetes bacterium]|nr:hypothetical protein [Planctomycetota bacterium]